MVGAGKPKGSGAQEWSLPLDVTGDARYSEERARVRAMLTHLQAYDGGMLWDASTSTLTIQMTTEDALQQARLLLLVTSPTWLRVIFVEVQYSALALEELAARLFEHQTAWAGASGISGGVDYRANRVQMLVNRNHEHADTLVQAINHLNDPRITLEIYTSGSGVYGQPRG
ncbi:hypothetical protein ACIBL3_37015 [Kribbella sp. NPDC050124]|uniref:hypothetical protein n=1 Tax=Kribbella sp. NPDC050124 TaxID=3364114 RepID=UPI0037B01737